MAKQHFPLPPAKTIKPATTAIKALTLVVWALTHRPRSLLLKFINGLCSMLLLLPLRGWLLRETPILDFYTPASWLRPMAPRKYSNLTAVLATQKLSRS